MKSPSGPRKERAPERAVDRYLRSFKENLRIDDVEAADDITEQLRAAVLKADGGKDDHDLIVSALGRPETLAARISDPENWSTDIGTPLRPKIPLKERISRRSMRMLLLMFLFGLCVSAFMALSGSFPLIFPAVTASFVGTWALETMAYINFTSYLDAYENLIRSGIKVSGVTRKAFRSELWSSIAFLFLLSLVICLSPMVLDMEGILISIPLFMITTMGLAAFQYIIRKQWARTRAKVRPDLENAVH